MMRDLSTAIAETTSHLIRHANLLYPALLSPYSHSIVPGGLDVTSYTTRLTPSTSLMIRVAVTPLHTSASTAGRSSAERSPPPPPSTTLHYRPSPTTPS